MQLLTIPVYSGVFSERGRLDEGIPLSSQMVVLPFKPTFYFVFKKQEHKLKLLKCLLFPRSDFLFLFFL